MAKLNANYEVLYVIDPNLGEEATADVVAKAMKDWADEKVG